MSSAYSNADTGDDGSIIINQPPPLSRAVLLAVGLLTLAGLLWAFLRRKGDR